VSRSMVMRRFIEPLDCPSPPLRAIDATGSPTLVRPASDVPDVLPSAAGPTHLSESITLVNGRSRFSCLRCAPLDEQHSHGITSRRDTAHS
jgi:hypothetical protein